MASPPTRPRGQLPVEVLLLAAVVAAAALTGPLPLLLVGVLAALWLRLARLPRERLAAVILIAVAVTAAAFEARERWRSRRPEAQRQRIGQQFSRLWSEMTGARDHARTALEGLDPADTREAFERLGELAEAGEAGLYTFMLVDPDGIATAWAGRGLIHELEPEDLPRAGWDHVAGFGALTVVIVTPLEEAARPWRLVSGQSLDAGDLPWPIASLGPLRWSVLGGDEEAPPGYLRLQPGSGPAVAVQDWRLARPPPGSDPERRHDPIRAVLALCLLAVGLGRFAGDVAGRDGAPRRVTASTLLPLLGGLAVAVLALDPRPGTGLLLLPAAALLAWLAWSGDSGGGRIAAGWRAAGVGLALVALAHLLQRLQGPLDLGSRVLGTAPSLALRLALCLAAFALLGLAFRGSRPGQRGFWPLALGLALLALAAALHDSPWLALACLVPGGALSAWWLAGRGRPVGWSGWAPLAALSLALAAPAWELAHRQAVKRDLAQVKLPGTAPLARSEIDELARRVQEHFLGLDIAALTVTHPADLDPLDLAYRLWSESPLAVRGALSAVAVDSDFGASSAFSFGLPLDREGRIDWSPARWKELGDIRAQRQVIDGESRLLAAGEIWGTVRFWLLPRPGFRLAAERIVQPAEGLLRGQPNALLPPAGLLGSAEFALFDAAGAPVAATWRGSGAAPRPPPGSLGRRVETPGGSGFAFAAADGQETRVLFLPALAPLEAAERVATHGLGVLLLLAALALAAAALHLDWRDVRRFGRRVARSYSRRMLVIYTSLLLVPILLLNLFLVRLFAERLRREQLAAGRAALESAQRVLSEYVLTLAPGFGMETQLDDELMLWLSRVVHHEVNLYWGSTLYASSKRDLFAAALLPQRIPGRIYSRLALGDAGIASRTNLAGGSTYLELYGALELPGVPANRARLFVSTPLLAQQVETEAELKSLRRRALLATTALMLLLAVIGARLTRSFTAPLMEIVRGTQRIAGGATSLELEPSDSELARLTEAIDRMARSIAEGRQKLLREKTLVDRMIDNITSGVVSIDRRKRVLLLNRVARGLLGAEVGEALDESLGRRADLAAVADFLAAAGAEPAMRTVSLGGEGEEREWTLVWVPLAGEGEPSALLVVEDVTEVLRGQRLQAWAEMARIIAHEIKNPLTPIRLSTEHLREVYGRGKEDLDEVFERCTGNILEQVEELQRISSEFSVYSRIPRIEPKPGNLSAAVAKVVDAYRSSPARGVRVEFESRPPVVGAEFDARLIGRAVRNLLENALRVTPPGGRIGVRVASDDGWAAIQVEDEGPGVPAADLPRIFDPYFSTHDAGTGLGLPIARRIAEEHGGAVEAHNRPRGGLEVVIRLPLGR